MIKLAASVAMVLLTGLLLLLFQAGRTLVLKRAADRRALWLMRLRVAVALLLLLLLVCGIWGTLIEPNRLIVHQQTVQLENWPRELNGLRVALIGDVHTGGPFINYQKLRQIVDLTNQQNPDLIVLLGDYMSPNSWHSHRVEPEVTAGVLKDLHAPLGVYAILGNHDWWYNGEKVWRAFDGAGMHVLENDVAEIKWHDKSFWLIGFADLWTRHLQVAQTIAKVPPGSATIGLTHNPDL